jgi:hypothetical protein
MSPSQVPDEYLVAIHDGATPVPMRDRESYYAAIARWLDACPLLTHHALAEAIRSAQRGVLRPPVEV